MNDDICGARVIHREKVVAAQKAALGSDDVEAISQLFKAVGDPSRLRILYGLIGREMCVCDLAALLQISESAVSHQLRLLRTLRLVKNRREGTVLYYRLADDHVMELIRVGLDHIREESGN